MKFAPVSDLLDTAAGSGTAAAGAVCVLAVEVEGLRDEGLSLRLSEIGRAESRLAAMKARVLAEVGRRHSNAVAQRIARDELQSSKREAKRDVESAVQLAQLPATSEALESGEIPQGHARLIARASGESNIDEALLVEAANEQPFDEFIKTVRRHQQDCSKDDGQAILDQQRERRSARIFESPETGMFVLSGQFDQITGTRIATALTAKERELWHREDPNARRTPQQRMADALAELVCEPGDGKTQGTNLLVIADYDVIKQELINARLADGSPIPIGELRLLARDADILPSIFDAKTQNMWLGRQRRTASEAQRVALMARDEGCVCCKANPLWCKAHHIIWWSKDGPTDLDNLLLVCDDCHKKIHLHGWTVHQHPKTRKYYLKPPNPNGSNQAQQERNQTGEVGGSSTGSQANQPARSGRVNGSQQGRDPTHEIDEIKGRSTAAQPNPQDRRNQEKVNSSTTQPSRRGREKVNSGATQHNRRGRRRSTAQHDATQPTRSGEGQQRGNTTQPARSTAGQHNTTGEVGEGQQRSTTQPSRRGREKVNSGATQHNRRGRRRSTAQHDATQPTRSGEGQQRSTTQPSRRGREKVNSAARRNPASEVGRRSTAQHDTTQPARSEKVNSGARHNPAGEVGEGQQRSTTQPSRRGRRRSTAGHDATQPARSGEGQQRGTTQPSQRGREKVNRDTPGAQPNRGGRKGSEGDHFGGD